MVNEQFTWLTPRSQQEQVGLPGLTDDTTFYEARLGGSLSQRGTKDTKAHKEDLVFTSTDSTHWLRRASRGGAGRQAGVAARGKNR